MNVVFDLGAVLLTWLPAQMVATTFPQLAPTPEAAKQMAHAIFSHADWHAFDCGTLEMDDVVQRTALRLNLPHPQLHGLVSTIGEQLMPILDTMGLLEQLVELRRQQKGLNLYYLSNMPRCYARTLQQHHAFLQWFDGGIFSGDVKLIKPDPAIYQLLQQRFALEPVQTVFIDDVLGNVKAAKALGWHGIHFATAAQVQRDLQALNLWG